MYLGGCLGGILCYLSDWMVLKWSNLVGDLFFNESRWSYKYLILLS